MLTELDKTRFLAWFQAAQDDYRSRYSKGAAAMELPWVLPVGLGVGLLVLVCISASSGLALGMLAGTLSMGLTFKTLQSYLRRNKEWHKQQVGWVQRNHLMKLFRNFHDRHQMAFQQAFQGEDKRNECLAVLDELLPEEDHQLAKQLLAQEDRFATKFANWGSYHED